MSYTDTYAQHRITTVAKYEAYKQKYLSAGQQKKAKCGIQNMQEFSDDYIFYFPLGSKNDFYVDDMGSLQYFVIKSDGKIIRKWAGTFKDNKINNPLLRDNNFIIYNNLKNHSIINICGKLPKDKRVLELFSYNHVYVLINKQGAVVCRVYLGDSMEVSFKKALARTVTCNDKDRIKTND